MRLQYHVKKIERKEQIEQSSLFINICGIANRTHLSTDGWDMWKGKGCL